MATLFNSLTTKNSQTTNNRRANRRNIAQGAERDTAMKWYWIVSMAVGLVALFVGAMVMLVRRINASENSPAAATPAIPPDNITEGNKGKGGWIAVFVNAIGLSAFGIVGSFVGKAIEPAAIPVGVACFASLWLAIYVALGLRIPQPKEFLIVVRLGEFRRVADSGWTVLCLPGIIDQLADIPKFGKVGSYRTQEEKLYTDEKGSEVDLTDASVSMNAKVYWNVIDAYKFTFGAKDPVSRLREIMDGLVRVFFSGESVDTAQAKKANVSEVLSSEKGGAKATEAKNAIEEMGIAIRDNKGLVIADIEIPDDIQKMRSLKLEGEKEAQKWVAKGGGYGMSIKAVADALGVDTDEATRIYETQRGFEVLEGLKANTNFVSHDMKGILVSVGAGQANAGTSGGSKNKKEKQP